MKFKAGDLTEHTLASEWVFEGRLLRVKRDTVRLPNGTTTTREHIIHPGAVMIIPLLDSGELVMERQFRYALGHDVIEFPAGKIDAGEAPLDAAKRELREETGFSAGRWEHLRAIHVAIAYSNERIDLYLAEGLTRTDSQPDADEFLEVLQVPVRQAQEWLAEGRITDVKTVVGLMMLEKRLGAAR